MKEKVICYGAGDGGLRLVNEIEKIYEILFFVDSDSKKWKGGGQIKGYAINSPEIIFQSKDYAYIIITSAPGMGTIVSYLKENGVPENRIITGFVDAPLKARAQFLSDFADLYRDMNGVCAECGVFQGDFASVINTCFADRTLYLFDTFMGFDERDVAIESSCDYSSARVSDYAGTSTELVMSKMKYPDKVIVRRGYFPETAFDITEKFCFVNLDLDLYKPTLEGLKWLSDKMEENGIILVHDYFSTNFRGIYAAVNEFKLWYRKKKLWLMPIGDGISIALVGF